MANALKYRTPLIVEFVGLPGAGKTTISNLIYERYGEFHKDKNKSVKLKVINDLRGWFNESKKWKRLFLLVMKFFFAFVWAIIKPQILISVLKHSFCQGNQPKITAIARILQFYNCIAFLTWIKLYTKFFNLSLEYILLDQGVIQSIVSLNMSCPNILVEITDNICLPDIVLYMNVGADVAAKRLFNRKTGRSRLDRMERSSAEKLIFELEKKFNNCIASIQNRTKIFKIVSEPGDVLEEVALRVVEVLRNFLVR